MGIIDLRISKLQSQTERQAFAVVVYHRGLIYEAIGETDAAQADFDRVRELGFEPNENLF